MTPQGRPDQCRSCELFCSLGVKAQGADPEGYCMFHDLQVGPSSRECKDFRRKSPAHLLDQARMLQL